MKKFKEKIKIKQTTFCFFNAFVCPRNGANEMKYMV